MAEDIVYANHEFSAENEDELSFSAGEAIVVLERDEQYGDGWFQGRNTQGEVGLFPQSYTSPDPPSDSPTPSSPEHEPHHDVKDSNGTTALPTANSDLQQTLDQLKVDHNQSATLPDSRSVRSRMSQVSRDGGRNSDDDEMPRNPRAMLAAKAAANAEKEAKNERERDRAEMTRQKEEDAKRRGGGMASGIQLSDESEEEEERVPEAQHSEVRDEPIVEVLSATPPPPEEHDIVSPTSFRPRLNSATSATSVYPDEPSSPNHANAPPFPTFTPSASANSLSPLPAPIPTSSRHFDLDSLSSDSDLKAEKVAGIAGLAGLAGAGAAGLTAAHSTLNHSPNPAGTLSPVMIPATFPSAIPVNDSNASRFSDVSPIFDSPRPLSAMIPTPPVISPSASMTSIPHSQESSRQGHAPAGTATGDTSPRTSSYGGTAGKFWAPAEKNSGKDLPYDPTTWGVAEVCEWGKAKGFDDLTLSKFQEHEISGDILLEMDVAMLKEIDLAAFGRRVHIYNAIKELKARVGRAGSISAVSPTLSGYVPDSPGTLSYASPGTQSHFAQDLDARSANRASEPTSTQFNGTTYDNRQRSASLVSASSSTGPSPLRSSISRYLPESSQRGHERTGTMDSYNTADGNGNGEAPIPEEEEESSAVPSVVGAGIAYRRPSQVSKSRGSGSDSASDIRNSSATAAPKHRSKVDSFFESALGRSRKPPPNVPAGLGKKSEMKSKPSISGSSRRGTRLFPSFGGSGSGEKTAEPAPRKGSVASLGTTRDAPSSMSPKTVGMATGEMSKAQPEEVTDGNLLEKIGSPDYSGWLRKKGEKYNTWKQRYFILKGIHLYYLKSENEQKIKGFINLSGYRVLADPNIHVGEFGFKIVHEVERTHYFSASEQVTVRTWMKEIMKATIGRDYSATVVSSCNVETMPLEVAQSMSPRPRPPSPASRARVQKERSAGTNTNTLSPKDAAILMEFSPPVGSKGVANVPDILPTQAFSQNQSISDDVSSATPTFTGKDERVKEELLSWVNGHLDSSTARASDLSTSLRSGRVLVRLVESLSGTSSGIGEEAFLKYRPGGEDQVFFISEYFDTVFSVFDYISPLVSTDDISMDDMLSGNEAQMIDYLERCRAAYPSS